MAQLPPWLRVSPQDFVRAASEGAQAGLAVARLNREADEAAQRSGQQGREFEEAQALRKWEQQQAMQMHAEQMREKQKEQQQQLSALTAYRQSMNEARMQAEKDRSQSAADLKDYRNQSLGNAVQRMENLEAHRKEIEAIRQQAEERQAQSAKSAQDLREQNAALRGQATYKLPGAGGAVITGKASDPEIAALLAQRKAAADKPGLLKRIWNATTGAGEDADIPPVGPAVQTPNRTLLGPGGYLSSSGQPSPIPDASLSASALPIAAPSTPTGATPRKFKDASGKVWTYTGSADNPLSDTDVSHWQE